MQLKEDNSDTITYFPENNEATIQCCGTNLIIFGLLYCQSKTLLLDMEIMSYHCLKRVLLSIKNIYYAKDPILHTGFDWPCFSMWIKWEDEYWLCVDKPGTRFLLTLTTHIFFFWNWNVFSWLGCFSGSYHPNKSPVEQIQPSMTKAPWLLYILIWSSAQEPHGTED